MRPCSPRDVVLQEELQDAAWCIETGESLCREGTAKLTAIELRLQSGAIVETGVAYYDPVSRRIVTRQTS